MGGGGAAAVEQRSPMKSSPKDPYGDALKKYQLGTSAAADALAAQTCCCKRKSKKKKLAAAQAAFDTAFKSTV